MKINKKVKLVEKIITEYTTTAIFIAPKKYIKDFIYDKECPTAPYLGISIKYSNYNPVYSCEVCVVPSDDMGVEIDNYDWKDIELSDDKIKKLILLCKKGFDFE